MIDGVLSISNYIASTDVETTGGNPSADRIWQVGVVRVNPDGSVSEGSEYVNPTVPIPSELVEKFKLTEEILERIYSSPVFSTLAPKLHHGLSNADALVGFNIQFDVRFFTAEFQRCGLAFSPPPLLDAFKVYTKFHPRTLTAAVKEYLDEELEGAHDGLNDARAALRVLVAQLKRHTELPRDVGELHKMFFETVSPGNVDAAGKIVFKNGVACLSFGKWAGVPLNRVSSSYLEWMAGADFPDDTKRVIRNALAGKFPLPSGKG